MTAVPTAVRHSARRRTPRFMARNERWIKEVREKRPLWTEWANQEWANQEWVDELPEEERATDAETGGARGEVWTSAYSGM